MRQIAADSHPRASKGTVVYSYSGRLEAAERKTFFDSLSRLLGVELGAEPQP